MLMGAIRIYCSFTFLLNWTRFPLLTQMSLKGNNFSTQMISKKKNCTHTEHLIGFILVECCEVFLKSPHELQSILNYSVNSLQKTSKFQSNVLKTCFEN